MDVLARLLEAERKDISFALELSQRQLAAIHSGNWETLVEIDAKKRACLNRIGVLAQQVQPLLGKWTDEVSRDLQRKQEIQLLVDKLMHLMNTVKFLNAEIERAIENKQKEITSQIATHRHTKHLLKRYKPLSSHQPQFLNAPSFA